MSYIFKNLIVNVLSRNHRERARRRARARQRARTRARARRREHARNMRAAMPDLPEDLIMDVLSRLPVKTLTRLRCVSRGWNALINSPGFLNMHIKQSLEKHLTLILEVPHNIYSLGFASLHHNTPPDSFDLTLLDRRFSVFKLAGCCRGLLCLSYKESGNPILINPFTKEFLKPPGVPPLVEPLALQNSEMRRRFYGFGYHNGDYKIVRVTDYILNMRKKVMLGTDLAVFSVRLNTWTRIGGDFPYILNLLSESYGVLLNDALHWLATRQYPKRGAKSFLVVFNFASEDIVEVQLPNVSMERYSSIGHSGGKLFLSAFDGQNKVDLWVMRDYMVEESWTRISTDFLFKAKRHIWNMRIVSYPNSTTKVLLTLINDQLCWLDLERERVMNLDIGIRCFEAEGCIPTLSMLPSALRNLTL